ncbi:FAD-binding oxidoreductase [Shimia ponticola]|uniref:FAD-binding oxidoreductase n=1 Tax=Shimia ponticola TaxID=2582893 RepID=UPI0011BFC05E|nr:FAD-binding oxidoreductase [Shimia ponticola]
MTDLSPVTPDFEASLRAALPDAAFKSPEPKYFEEPRGRFQGAAGVVLAPASTTEVAAAVRLAHEAGVPVVPYGGGTGLVGGQIAGEGPAALVLSLERMTRIRNTWPRENLIEVEAGAILADVQAKAKEVDRLFPLSLASEGSARIGGLLATNAGGVNVLRYGNMRDLCLGLEVVLPNGDIWNGLTRLRKDNLGYDLRNLMIGSEGTLGVITAATLKLSPIPATRGTAMIAVPSPDAALDLLALARNHVGDGVVAFELIHEQGYHFLSETLPDVRHPFETPPEWSVLIELGLPSGLDPAQVLMEIFEAAAEAHIATDGTIAQSETQRAEFWAVREKIPEANRRIGSVSSHDISVPMEAIPEFIERGPGVLTEIGNFRINCFGHVGDGNLHYNVFPQPGRSRADHDNERPAIKRAIHDLTHELGGSVAAEHGVGRLKVEDVQAYADPTHLALMRQIKDALDPKGIMNPGVILPAS